MRVVITIGPPGAHYPVWSVLVRSVYITTVRNVRRIWAGTVRDLACCIVLYVLVLVHVVQWLVIGECIDVRRRELIYCRKWIPYCN